VVPHLLELMVIATVVAVFVLGEVPEARNRTAVTFSGLLRAVVATMPLAADFVATASGDRSRTRIIEQAGRIIEFLAGLCGAA
jgi:ABC-type Zn uptake system ZnuABC Zn-binding protein ZnuA